MSAGNQHLGMSSNYCRLTPGYQRKICPSCHTQLVFKYPECQAAIQEVKDLSCFGLSLLKARSTPMEASACPTWPTTVTCRKCSCGSLTFFSLHFQSLFHWRKNRHGFKCLPLKSHTKYFGDLGSDPDGTLQKAKETTSRAVAITASPSSQEGPQSYPEPTPTFTWKLW